MPETKLIDNFDAQIWASAIQEASTAKNAFIASGVASLDGMISEKLKGGANTVDLGYWEGLDGVGEANVSTDNRATQAATNKIATKKQIARSASLNQAWAFSSLAREMNPLAQDPVGAVTSKLGGYWAKQNQNRLVQSINGIVADNIANNGGDMVFDNAGTVAAVTASMFLDAEQTLGDAKGLLTAVAMHSVIENSLKKLKLVEPVYDSSGQFLFNSYLGKRVIVDDTMPVDTTGADPVYTTAFFAAGAVGFGEGTVDTPAETEREALAGNGGGYDVIISRINPCFHPYGFAFNSTTVASESPTSTELALPANWTRVAPRKLVPMAFLKSLA